ncbi:MAG: hypothetical protein K6T73_11330 [Candidatus Bathyarchaeota archaeon]|nr:hypothetical protein [Candidatus Bathyarchaeota archaeon]
MAKIRKLELTYSECKELLDLLDEHIDDLERWEPIDPEKLKAHKEYLQAVQALRRKMQEACSIK